MRRRRLIFRSVVLVLSVVAAVLLAVPFSLGGGILVIVLAIVAAAELAGLVRVLRDRRPDHPPQGAWWWCELPLDHKEVRLDVDDPTWRCRRCGDLRHTPPARSTIDIAAEGEAGIKPMYHD